jgi:hypothetical protein
VISDAGRAAQGTTADGSVSIDADGGGGGNPPPDAQGNVAVDRNDGGPHGDLTTSDASATPDADEGGRGQTSTVTRWTCDGDYAYWATSSIVFTAPTPAALAKAFSIVSVDVHPISLVLHLEKSALLGALSATISGSQHADVFSSNEVPSFASAVPAFGAAPGVTTVEPQQSAFLHFEDRTGAIAIQLEHVVWRATEGTSCNDLTVAFQAVLPSSQLAVVLHLPDGDRTIAQVLSAPDAGPTVAIVNPIVDASSPVAPVEIGAVFEAAPTTFDFTTL